VLSRRDPITKFASVFAYFSVFFLGVLGFRQAEKFDYVEIQALRYDPVPRRFTLRESIASVQMY